MYKTHQFMKLFFLKVIFTLFITGSSLAEYPATSVGVIDLNYILSEAKAAKDAANQIEEIAIKIEEEVKASDQDMLDEQNKLIESQSIMATNVFEEKRLDYEKKVQNYNLSRQEKLISIDMLVSESRNDVLNALKPILEDIANDKGITILLEKNSVLLNADSMDITDEALKKLDKDLPKIDVNQE